MDQGRVRLEKYIGLEDYHYYASLVFNESVMNMNLGRTFTKDEADEYFKFMLDNDKNYEYAGNFKVFIENNNSYLGTATLRLYEDLSGAEIEYMLLPDYWGQGFGTEVVSCLLKLAANFVSVKEITAITTTNNIHSKKVLIKNGFKSDCIYKVEENNSFAELFKKIL